MIDFREVKIKIEEQFNVWFKMFGDILKEMANKELLAIQSRIADYNKDLDDEPATIDILKKILNVITTIKDKSMEMEFRINDV